VRPVAISVDAPQVSENLRREVGYTFTFLSDSNTEIIRRYDLLHKGAGENGHDIARPAEFLIDRSGAVRWANLTEDLRIRARPEQMLAAAREVR
jgi:peroxiredoxin